MAGRGRTALVAALAAVALAAATLAAWPASPRGSAAPAPVATPVLSIRGVPAFVSDAVAAARLRQRLDAALGGRARTCVVADDQRAAHLYSPYPDLPLVPASNFKLLAA